MPLPLLYLGKADGNDDRFVEGKAITTCLEEVVDNNSAINDIN